MKLLKFLAGAAVCAATLSQSASATVPHIYITGSTAFRTAALTALDNVLVGTFIGSHGTANDSGISNTGNTSFIWYNCTLSGTSVVVCATFTGSQSGVASVANSASQIPFLPDNVTGTTNASCYSDVAGSVANSSYPTATPDIAFTDVFQATTPFNGFLSKTGINYATCTDTKVAIATFKWVASKGFPKAASTTPGVQSTASTSGGTSSISIEPQFIGQLLKSGQSWLNCMTGNSVDADTELYATGRNPDSGSRGTTFADAQYGVATAVKQYQVVTVASNTVSSIQLFPISTIAGLSTGSVGNSGEASGANLRVYAGYTYNAGSVSQTGNEPDNVYFVTYLGIGDAATAEGLGGVELAYKGVNYSNAAFYNGQYTMWGYEHLLCRSSISGNASTLYNNLVSNLTAKPIAFGGSQNAAITGGIAGVGFNLNDPNIWFQRGGDGLSMTATTTFNNLLQSSAYPF